MSFDLGVQKGVSRGKGASQHSLIGTRWDLFIAHDLLNVHKMKGTFRHACFVHVCAYTHMHICKHFAFLVPGTGMRQKIFMVSGLLPDKSSD